MRDMAKSFEDLIVWQKAHKFVLGVYIITQAFPKSEIYGITSQLRRSAVSIAANIAEGFKKKGKQDKVRFLNIAQGSLHDLKYTEIGELNVLLTEVSKLLEGYSQTIKNSIS